LTIAAVADTHTALWYLFGDSRLSRRVTTFIDEAAISRNKIAISSISLAELVYLVEKSRLPAEAYRQLTDALADPEHVFTEAVFTTATVESMRRISRAEVPDMPDRMIAATALYFDVPVLSRDQRIRTANLMSIW
jgi:PIN domain nuclease of toxin-antitoxin system